MWEQPRQYNVALNQQYTREQPYQGISDNVNGHVILTDVACLLIITLSSAPQSVLFSDTSLT